MFQTPKNLFSDFKSGGASLISTVGQSPEYNKFIMNYKFEWSIFLQ
jgi:hypothetical protein